MSTQGAHFVFLISSLVYSFIRYICLCRFCYYREDALNNSRDINNMIV